MTTEAPHRRDDRPHRVWALLISTAISRVPTTVFSVLFVIQGRPYGPAAAGTAVLLFSVGSALSGALAGWMQSRYDHRMILSVSGVLACVLLLVLGSGDIPVGAFWAGAFGVGVVFPATHISARSVYPIVTDGARLLQAYSWDVSLVQVSWIIAPALVIVVAPVVGGLGVHLILAALMLVGLVWYVAIFPVAELRVVRDRQGSGSSRASGNWTTLLTEPRTLVYLLTVACIMFISGLVLPVIMDASSSSMLQAVAVSVWSVGSTVASVVVNRNGIRRRRLVSGVLIAMAAAAFPIALGNVVLFGFALLALGFAMSPITGAVFYGSSRTFTSDLQPIVFGIVTSSQLVAQGIGSAVSGALLDTASGHVSIAAIFFGVLTVLVSLVVLNPGDAFGRGWRPGRGAWSAFKTRRPRVRP
ncbi:MFS transporter [Propionicicella superfundia]|uniref:MFS transporter n=1 Tax=Propionicicella superfundia TaxID=348582 RepID=UPI00041EDA34|nr:MFS transporter [Propionicicella superfundia]